MTENDVAHEKIAQHSGADLAGKRAASFPIHVLGPDLDVLLTAERFSDLRDGGERRDNYYLHFRKLPELQQEHLDEGCCFRLSHVHFPVRGYDFLSHQVSNGEAE